MNNETNKPSAAALRIAKELEMAHYSPVLASERISKKAALIDAELSAERKAAEEMRNLLKILEPMIEDEYPNSATRAGVLVAAYDAAAEGVGMKKHDRRAKLAPKLLKRLLKPLRKAARGCGYALAVHGSVRRDIDLVAIPWMSEAKSECNVSDALYRATKRVLGFEPVRSWSMRGRRFTLRGCPGVKPHGRLGWVWQIGGGVYIDLSVMPRKKGKVTT